MPTTQQMQIAVAERVLGWKDAHATDMYYNKAVPIGYPPTEVIVIAIPFPPIDFNFVHSVLDKLTEEQVELVTRELLTIIFSPKVCSILRATPEQWLAAIYRALEI